jgi:hypothetical protein
MPTELLIAFIAFGVVPVGLMLAAAIIAWLTPSPHDPFNDSRYWGSQDIDQRRK